MHCVTDVFWLVPNEIKCYQVISYNSSNCNLVIVVITADLIIVFIVDLLYICIVHSYIKFQTCIYCIASYKNKPASFIWTVINFCMIFLNSFYFKVNSSLNKNVIVSSWRPVQKTASNNVYVKVID